MRAVNIYDFDHTIYDGDASLDFIIYCLKNNPRLWKYLPLMFYTLALYVIGIAARKRLKESAFSFLKDIKDIDTEVAAFWDAHRRKIKKFYIDLRADNDIIVSASPEFLLEPIVSSLGAKLIATKMNKASGVIIGENCRGVEKVSRLNERYPELVVASVYSDSLSDAPLIELGKKGYMVSGDTAIPFNEYRMPLSARLTSLKFLRFILVGCINASIGISIAYTFSLFIKSPQLSFLMGFTLGLVPSYFLNSIIIFKDRRFSLKKFRSYVISYIPNFLIMFFSVHILTVFTTVIPLVAYVVAVVVAVPLTFMLLSLYTFKDGGRSERGK